MLQRIGMKMGSLYEQAVALSPKAARIAAFLLIDEPQVPEPLRRSLGVALSSCDADATVTVRWTDEDPDAQAARRFVEACREYCEKKASPRAQSDG